MKAIKYLMIGALMIGFNVSAMAQDDHKAVIDQVTKIIKSKSATTESAVKDVVKANKKNADVLTAIGRAYLDVKDTANANKYCQMAMQRDKKYGNAYVLAGDIEVAKDNGGAASAWFEQATFFDPKNPEGYRRYAQVNSKVSPEASAAKLEELRKNIPDYPVDIISAEIYDKAQKIDKALEYYEKVDKAKMEDYQLVSFATDYFLKGKYDKSLEVAQYGVQKFPRNAALNRLNLFNQAELKNFDEAVKYGDALFNKSDSAKISEVDHQYYGHALMGAKQYDNAIAEFKLAISTNPDNEACKADAFKSIAEAYKAKGDFNAAVSAYNDYIKGLSKVTAYDLGNLASMYMDQADKAPAAEKRSYYDKADGVYAEIAEKFPSVADFATLQRAHIGYTLDPDTKMALAKPHYEKLIEIITSKTEKGDRDNERLVEAYRYLGYYYLLKNDKATANSYWNKVLEIDPNNESAKQALGK